MSLSYIAVSVEEQKQAKTLAVNFVKEILSLQTGSVAFGQKVVEVKEMGEFEMERCSRLNSKLLERSAFFMGDAKEAPTMAAHIKKLRSVTFDTEMGEPLWGFIPAGSLLAKNIRRRSVRGILSSVAYEKDNLLAQNGFLNNFMAEIVIRLKGLHLYAYLSSEVEVALSLEIESLVNSGDVEHAFILSSEVLPAVRERKQDILMQLALTTQTRITMENVIVANSMLVRSTERLNKALAA